MNKRVLLIVFIVLVIILILVGMLQVSKKNSLSSSTKNFADSLIKKFETGEELLIYFSNSDGTCTYCDGADMYVKYIADVYNIEFVNYNINRISKDDMFKIEKHYGLPEGYTVAPAIYFVKEGTLKVGMVGFGYESEVIDKLIELEYINKDDVRESYIDDDDKFKEFYKTNENELILLYEHNDNSYKYRKEIFNLSKEYNFKYSVIITDFVGTRGTKEMFEIKYGNSFKMPSIAVVSNNEIVDYTSASSGGALVEFLKKNKIIN